MNKNVYYPTYTIDPESIYGSGIVKANKFPVTNTTTSVITDSFPINKKLSPPVYRSGLSLKPLDTNGYRILKDPYGQKYKLDNYYYASQQNNNNTVPNIEPTLKEKLVQKIKNVADEIVDNKTEKKDLKKLAHSSNNLRKKNNSLNEKNKNKNKNKNRKITKNMNFNKKNYKVLNNNDDIDNNDFDENDIDENDSGGDSDVDADVDEDVDVDNNDNKKKLKSKINAETITDFIDKKVKLNSETPTDNFGRNKKMWINDHYLYALEPRYASVVYPWRAYTWMYPVTPNTDNYYIDNINSSPADPIIVSNDSTNRGNYQATYLKSNMLNENFNSLNDSNNELNKENSQKTCGKNYNLLYFIIIILILSIYFYKE